MKTNEYDYYNDLANWSFDDIDYISESLTNWDYEEEIKKKVRKESKILDLGTAAGENLLKVIPDCAEVLGTDFSSEMINTANENLKKSGRKNITFRVMDNLNMNTPENHFDLVIARHTIIDPVQIYKTLKENGQLIVRGVDKLDCWSLKRLFKRGQAYHDLKPISQKDYEAIMNAGFKEVELIPIHVIEYYRTKEDLYALLIKTPILNDFSEETSTNRKKHSIEKKLFEKYIEQNMTEKGIRLIRRYYGIVAKK